MTQKRTGREIQTLLHNIAWLRKHNGLSQQEMAKLLGVSVLTIKKIESGTLPPRMRVSVLFRIQVHFGISASEQVSKRLKD